MESFDSFAATNSLPSRRKVQGPRPTSLKVFKESHKIKKPPVAPPRPPPGQPTPPPRQPVIIYTISPKVVHAEPSNFMSIVQQLTGSDPSSKIGSRGLAANLSPAAYEAVQAAAAVSEGERRRSSELITTTDLADQLGMVLDRSGLPAAGIVSPTPAALPAISPTFFSPAGYEPNYMGLFHELSPSFMAGSFLASTSPEDYWDPFNQF